MKKFFVLALALALTAGAAYANWCARDYVPAATLLVPYAVVDMDASGLNPDPSGYTTILSVTNVSSWRTIIHVTVWDPYSFHVVDFDEVLSGYDVWTINFRDLLTGHFDYFDTEGVNGMWASGSSSSVYGATKVGTTTDRGVNVIPFGPSTNPPVYNVPLRAAEDTDYPSNIDFSVNCAFPYGYHPEYGAGIVSALRADTFAPAYQTASCDGYQYFESYFPTVPWLANLDENPLFFYVTVDVVWRCNQLFPDDNGYWTDAVDDLRTSAVEAYEGYPAPHNVLIGEVIYLDTAHNFSEAMPAVHIEYDPDVPGNGPTFYCLAFDNDACGVDGREPLATAFAFRYFNSGGVSTDLLLWKNHAEWNYDYGWETLFTWACGPYVYYAWDEHENSKSRGVGPSGFDRPEPDVIPFETQAAPLDTANWTGLMANNGWMLLVFDPSIENFGKDWWTEAWAGVRYKYAGFSAGLEAATMANYWCFEAQRLPQLSYAADYYDQGNWYWWYE